ncbi:MAG: glutathione-disulfide reductase [Alphaproteobacteria bacterium]|nr:glutathione-disulfide reductase [Alphaproteobacteria bacterium]
MAIYDFDLFTIGAGSGGVRAARIAALAGARVAIAEEYRIGGTCVIRGCVPKKHLVFGARYSQEFEDAAAYGWTVQASFDWATLRDNVQKEVGRLSGIYATNLGKAGVEIIEQRAEIVDPHTVRLGDGRTITAERILVATGGRPTPLAIPGGEHAISSNEAFLLERLPERVLIIGGGYIAVEFATIFDGLGAATTLAYRGATILNGFDDDVRAHVQASLAEAGVNVMTNATPAAIEKVGAAFRVSFADGRSLEVDLVMAAIGRMPHTDGLGLEAAGVQRDAAGAVIVDAYSQTNVPSIYAVGDVTNRVNLTPIAIREGHAFADTVYNNRPTKVDHAMIPTAVFGHPPVGTVGLTEKMARASHDVVHVYKAVFRPMKHVVAGNPERTLMKIVVDGVTDRLLGVHIAGQDAPEMIQLAAVAVKAGLTKAVWDQTVALHPTAAEELVLMKTREPDPA